MSGIKSVMLSRTIIMSSITLSLSMLAVECYAASNLKLLNDDELSQETGQGLLNLNYIAPNQSSNPNTDIGFYRLGVEGEIALNANVNKLQLGCGGSKGVGCDIDIDQVRLTGVDATSDTDSGPGTDFLLNNPFIEFAIKNPDSASTREMVGLRLGALSALGKMSFGSNANTASLSDDTGINSLSGDIGVTVTNAVLNNVKACTFQLFGGCQLALSGSATVANYATTLLANRSSSFNLTGMSAKASSSLLGLTLSNVNMNNIPYSTVHQLIVANADGTATSNAYLSLQSQAINWQKVGDGTWNTTAAQKGWWLSIPETQVSNLTITQEVQLGLIEAGSGALGIPVNLDAVDLGQTPVDNCYGGLTFC
ncbi:hypothetical protein [Alkanindiges illinoisensis]|uniref:hypothetical protein n=1 Tax=Alkanindiges illinoisensis TaxID=197183 RepID=UPI0012EC7162|nr:hypothetical protein [Alkanindiges illinoisensis]